jgi:predicted O-methyltransferase YrrM
VTEYVPAEVERYAEAHSTAPDPLFGRLAAETEATQQFPEMMVGPLQGALLRFLVAIARPQRVLEIGVFTGWSSIAMAQALPPGATIVACDVNEETTAVARRYAEEAGVAGRIDFRVGPALETLGELEGPFDLVFLDARKDEYAAYYEAVLPKLADDGTILADNTLFGMREGHPLEAFNSHVRNDPRVECVLLPIREGLTLIRRRPS